MIFLSSGGDRSCERWQKSVPGIVVGGNGTNSRDEPGHGGISGIRESVFAMSASQLRLHDATTSSENGGRGQMGWARHRYHASDRKSVAVFFLVCALPLQLLGRVHVRLCASCLSARVCADVIE